MKVLKVAAIVIGTAAIIVATAGAAIPAVGAAIGSIGLSVASLQAVALGAGLVSAALTMASKKPGPTVSGSPCEFVPDPGGGP